MLLGFAKTAAFFHPGSPPELGARGGPAPREDDTLQDDHNL